MFGGQQYLNSYFQFQNYKEARKSSKAEKRSKLPTSSTASAPTDANSKFAKFFRSKNVTEHGIFPLPEKRKIVPVRKSDSGKADEFFLKYKNINNENPGSGSFKWKKKDLYNPSYQPSYVSFQNSSCQ